MSTDDIEGLLRQAAGGEVPAAVAGAAVAFLQHLERLEHELAEALEEVEYYQETEAAVAREIARGLYGEPNGRADTGGEPFLDDGIVGELQLLIDELLERRALAAYAEGGLSTDDPGGGDERQWRGGVV